jgi:hypothetical protein
MMSRSAALKLLRLPSMSNSGVSMLLKLDQLASEMAVEVEIDGRGGAGKAAESRGDEVGIVRRCHPSLEALQVRPKSVAVTFAVATHVLCP